MEYHLLSFNAGLGTMALCCDTLYPTGNTGCLQQERLLRSLCGRLHHSSVWLLQTISSTGVSNCAQNSASRRLKNGPVHRTLSLLSYNIHRACVTSSLLYMASMIFDTRQGGLLHLLSCAHCALSST